MLTEKALYSLPSGSSIQTIEQAALVRLVVFITVIILSNVIFRYCGLDKVYIPAIVFGYILLITKVGCKKWTGLHCLKLLYLFSVSFTYVLHTMLYPQNSFSTSFLGFATYVMGPGFWLLISLHIDDAESFLKNLFWKLRYYILAASILGIIQYFFSPTLFGLFSTDMSRFFAWASNLPFSEYSSFFRTTSIWVSPQICGLFLGLFIIGYYSFMGHNLSSFRMIFPYFFCGMCTFNKSFILNMLLLFFQLKISAVLKIFCIIGTVFILTTSTISKNTMPDIVQRLFSIEKILEEEINSHSRITIYEQKLKECVFLGNGIGQIQNTMTNKSDDAAPVAVAESFLLQILYELGVIPFCIFLLILIKQLLSCPSSMKLLMFATILSTVYIHAFNSIYMMFFYSLIFLDFNKKDKKDSICPGSLQKTDPET